MTRKFGTDGVRGKAGTALTAELAYTLGLAAATALTTPGEQRPTIVIGKDTRISGDMLEAALAAGIAAAGVNVTLLGIIPTPGVAALMRILNADAGAVISASHNPYYDNGIKFFSRGGYKLPDSMENAIETMLKTPDTISRATGAHIGRIRSLENADQLYVDLLLQQQSPNLANMKIALDCANGAASFLAPPLLQKLGAEVIVIGNHPDGININHACGSTHLKSLQKLVINSHAHLGLAFDGDADRLLAVDERGQEIDGDFLLAIITAYLKEKQLLAKNRVVVTQMSNLGFKLAMEKLGVIVEETKVGDRYVLERMQETGATAGGEQSGHLILSHYNSTGDGPAAALKLLTIITESGQSLSQLSQVMERLPQVLVNVQVSRKTGWQDEQAIVSAITAAETALAGQGRVLLRPSGTEPVIRVMAEGKNIGELQQLVDTIATAVAEKMN